MALEGIKNDIPAFSTAQTASTYKPEVKTEKVEKDIPQSDTRNFATNESEDKKGNVPSGKSVKQAVSDINKKISPDTYAQYGYHEETNRVTIKLVDRNSDKVIKEYPAEETLDMIAKVWELAGMFLDEKG